MTAAERAVLRLVPLQVQLRPPHEVTVPKRAAEPKTPGQLSLPTAKPDGGWLASKTKAAPAGRKPTLGWNEMPPMVAAVSRGVAMGAVRDRSLRLGEMVDESDRPLEY